MTDYMALFERMDPPYGGDGAFDNSQLGDGFPEELQVASQLWVATGYGQGIAAYLNFFLLADFIRTHDQAFPPRFDSFKSMAKSFYETDLFVRGVTDSGKKPTGGISAQSVREELAVIMRRHQNLDIPLWMMTYFGFQLLEAVEQECAPLTQAERQRHLSYFAKVYRIMGVPFSADRKLLEQYARAIEAAHARLSGNVEKHARNILAIGEMVGVRSDFDNITGMLPEATRAIYAPLHARLRPNWLRRIFLRIAGRFFVKRAVGQPRTVAPVSG